MPQASVLTLEELPSDRPMPLITRQRVIGEHVMISRVILEPGFEVPVHDHENEQMVVMLSGRAEFDLEEGGAIRTVTVGAGQVLTLPPNVPHGCRALERCEILDLFSPPSERTGVDAHGA